jgi:predicted CoA-substrate-specific enzyme activase
MKIHTEGPVYVAGIDSGSASTDAVIMDENRNILGRSVVPTGAGAQSGAEKALQEALQEAGIERKALSHVVTTGYGRESIGVHARVVTEITCHAKGANFLSPSARTVIDIGGQDSKVIRIDEKGNVQNFIMNDKCAAGTGRFLEMQAGAMELSMEKMAEEGLKWKNEVKISSMCTVFAESEVVSLVAKNVPSADIIHGLNEAIARKTSSLVKRMGGEPAYIMTGGVAQNRGVVDCLEKELGSSIFVSPDAQVCGAIGACLIALDDLKK